MSKLALILLAVTLVGSALCILMIVFMVGNDRHSDQPQLFRRVRSLGGALWFGLFLVVAACYWGSVALDADRRHTVITSPDIGWMTPAHGYAASALLFFLGLYSIILWTRERRTAAREATRRI